MAMVMANVASALRLGLMGSGSRGLSSGPLEALLPHSQPPPPLLLPPPSALALLLVVEVWTAAAAAAAVADVAALPAVVLLAVEPSLALTVAVVVLAVFDKPGAKPDSE